MAGPGNAIRAGRAFIELFADDRKLVRGLKRAQARLKAFGAGVTAMGTKLLSAGSAIAAPLLIATKIFTSAGDQIHKLSIKTGVSAEALSQLKFAAEQSGTSLEVVGKAIGKMQKGFLDTKKNLPLVNELLEELGLDLDALKGKSPEEQFLTLVDALAAIKDPSRQAGLAMTVFGKAGADLIPLMKGGRAAIAELMKEADRLGLTITGPMAESAAESADAWNRVKQTLRGVAIQVGGALAPTITKLGNTVAKITTTVINWVKANGPLIRTVFKIAAGAIAAGAALVAAGVLISSFGAVLGGIASAVGLVATAIGVLSGPVGVVVLALLWLGQVLAIALALAWKFSAGFREAVGGVATFARETFSKLAETVGTAFEGVKAALSLGDMQSAWKIATRGAQIVWLEFVDSLLKAWQGTFVDTIFQTMQQLINKIKQAIATVINAILKAHAALQRFTLSNEQQKTLTANERNRARLIQKQRDKLPALERTRQQGLEANATPEQVQAGQAAGTQIGRINKFLDKFGGEFDAFQEGAEEALGLKRTSQAELDAIGNAPVNSFADVLKTNEPELDRLRKQQAEAIAAIAAAKAAVQADPKIEQAIAKVLAVAGPVAQAAIAKSTGSEAAGTFSAEAARGLGASTVQEKQLDEAKKGNDELRKINKNLDKADELVFGA